MITLQYFLRMALIACMTAILVSCGGGGDSTASEETEEAALDLLVHQEAATSGALVPLAHYTGPTNTFQRLTVSMPSEGILDFALHGVVVRVFNSRERLIGASSATDPGYQVVLPAGNYIVEFQYWSANTRFAVAYSPLLMRPQRLPLLTSGDHSSGIQTAKLHRLTFNEETNIRFSGSGVNKLIYNRRMKLVRYLGETDYRVKLPAGSYIIKFHYWSSNAKSLTVNSPGLN